METQKSLQVSSGAHPMLDVLIEYYHERLEADAAEPIQEHLVHCRHCTALLLDLHDFSIAEGTQPASQDLAECHLLARAVSFQVRAERWRNTALLAAFLLVAATLLSGIYYRSHSQRGAGEMTAALSPEINLPIVSLFPRSALRGSNVNRLDLPPGSRFLSIVLTTVDLASFSDYQLVISDPANHEVLSLQGLRPSPLGTFSLGLPSSLLRPGNYQLRLLGLSGGRKMLMEEYPLEIVRLPPVPSSNSTAN